MAQQQNTPWGKYALIIGLCALCIVLGKLWGEEASTAQTKTEYDALVLDLEQLKLEHQSLKDSMQSISKITAGANTQSPSLDSVMYIDNRKFIIQDFSITEEKSNGTGNYQFVATGNLDSPAPRDIEIRFQLFKMNTTSKRNEVIFTGAVKKIKKGESFFEFKETPDEGLDGDYIVRFKFEKFKIERRFSF